jgi:two-component system cell cycle sensor histidine kinase/response regulator CckA
MGDPRRSVQLDQLPLVTYVAPLEAPCSVDYVSPQVEALLGFPPEDFVLEPDFWLGRVAAEDRELFVETWTSVRDTHDRVSVEYRLVARDGHEVWVRHSATVVTVDGIVTIQGFITDITREKELELELARERAQTDAFFRDSSVGMAITDAEGRFVRVNEALARMNALSPEEHVGRRLRDLSAVVADGVEPLLEEVWRTGEPVQGRELTVELESGETATSLVSYFPVDAAGAKHFGGIVIDVTDLRHALNERAEAAREYRRLVEQLPLVTYVNAIGPGLHATYVSPQVEQLFGHPPHEWLVDHGLWARVAHPDDVARVLEEQATARETGRQVECEYRIVRPDGSVRWVHDMMHTVRDEDGTPLFEQGFVIDVTDRKRAEQSEREAIDALRESEEQFRAVFDNAHDAMAIVDDDGRYIDVNRSACELYGLTRDALLALSVADITRAGAAPTLTWREFLDQGAPAGVYTIIRRDGTQRETEFAATANMLLGRHLLILRDVTERTRLERGLREAQKLESVGTLAAGIAHDFNNMLTAIGGYSQLLLARLSPGSVERSHAEEIERAAGRAAKLTAQLLAFGGRQMLQPRAVDLNALVADVSLLLSRIVGPEVVLAVEPENELRTVSADPKQMEQVIWNLVVNAADAMPAGGRVALRTRNVDVEHDAETASGAPAPELARGPYVELAISDSGYGMDHDTLEHVFEPFFTTKQVGLGEGLGLSTAYGIVKQSGGTIVAESLAGAGATFRIYLPATDNEPRGEARDPIGGQPGPR